MGHCKLDYVHSFSRKVGATKDWLCKGCKSYMEQEDKSLKQIIEEIKRGIEPKISEESMAEIQGLFKDIMEID